jgi:2-oxoglutarate dehydrogenase E1 component
MSDLSIFYGPNAGYVVELYERYQRDPGSVPPSTRLLFEHWKPPIEREDEQGNGARPLAAPPLAAAPHPDLARLADRIRGAAALAQSIREYGHLCAQIDPLGSPSPGDPELDPASHGITEADLAALPADIVGLTSAGGAANALEATERLRAIYCHTIGYDYDHVQVAEERAWLRDAAENRRFFRSMSAPAKVDLLERLIEVETFELFLHRTFPGQKRFSIEGADMLVPILDEAIRCQTYRGNREVVLGMAHRGRLNVLAHVLGKSYADILKEFERADQRPAPAASESGQRGWTGDVKYHLGARRRGAVIQVSITLAPNPSHLEFVNPVVEGMVRASQDRMDQPGPPQQDLEAALALLIHGDAAFPGEGVVAETLNLSRLAGYQTGGTIHIIVNNQIGFTTEPVDGRSTLYAGDLAKGFEIPIIHVNADDPEACLAAARLACAYRDQFHKDFLIDLVGYRRWGHNEGDDPAFTQPRLYEIIRRHPTVRELWAREMERQGVVSAADVEQLTSAALAQLEEARREATAGGESASDKPRDTDETELPALSGDVGPVATAVPLDTLRSLNDALWRFPEGFQIHSRLQRPLERRRGALDADGSVEWAHAETLAWASILADGTPIRLTGQDTERGTFSQRHVIFHDAETGETVTPLQALPMARASFATYNSPLSEMAPLGFEFGYSVQKSTTLVLWEAQFGDFINAAQVIVDQFIAAARAKWSQTLSMVLLLPHGYEGQGPEHSSARLERWLQLAAGDNLRIVNCTTAAQYFHLLRRQVALFTRDPRPLVVMSPKSLLRHPRAASTAADLATGSFQRVLSQGPLGWGDDTAARDGENAPGEAGRESVTRLLVCSGKIAVELAESDARAGATECALARIEELYPFPAAELAALMRSYPNLRELVWVQEEPQNMGAWAYVAPRIRELAGEHLSLRYVGRPVRASTAEGSVERHAIEQERIIREALGAGVHVIRCSTEMEEAAR